MNRGDVVMAVSGACGLPAILAVDACIHDGFVGFRSLSERIRAEYLYTFLAVIREETEKQAVGATFQNLKTDQIRVWKIPIPPIQIQDSFVERARSLRRLGDNMAHASGYSDSTFQSILAGVFSDGRAT
jgi:restriction endonuclease S subunit